MLETKQKIALAYWAQSVVMLGRRLLGLGPATVATRGGMRWSLDLREGIDFSIWLLGSFEPGTVRSYRRIIRRGNVILDIGANIGAHTLFFAESVGENGRVVAFEPTDYAYSKLKRNCALNPAFGNRIECIQAMLVDPQTEGERPPHVYSSWPLKPEGDLHALHRGRLMSTVGAQARTLDSIVNELGLTQIDFMKLDIDGHECQMLRGARETLLHWRPTIVMEFAPYLLEEHGGTLEELIDILKGSGYEIFSIPDERPLALEADVLRNLIPAGASINVMARAKA